MNISNTSNVKKIRDFCSNIFRIYPNIYEVYLMIKDEEKSRFLDYLIELFSIEKKSNMDILDYFKQ